jgi:hypothetical protein
MADVPLVEATVVRPGDHLIVRCEDSITMADAENIRRYVMERLPLLSDVTVIPANGLFVFRYEATDG